MTRRIWVTRAAVGAVVALGMGLGLAPDARAAAPAVQLSSPRTDGQVFERPDVTLSGQATQPDGGEVTAVRLAVTSSIGPGGTLDVQGNGGDTLPFSWTLNLSYNGQYEFRVEAVGRDAPFDSNGDETTVASRRFAIEAPPRKPANVKARVNDDRTVAVSWNANTEPDLIGYQVQRQVDGTWEPVGETTDIRFTDGTAPDLAGGDYQYAVVAVRAGASQDAGVSSERSSSARVTMPAKPGSETPTTNPDGSGGGGNGDGGGNGGNGGGDGGGTPDGSGGGGTGRTSTTLRSGGAGTPRATPPASGGRVDLSDFGLLLGEARNTAPAAQEPDTGFDDTLPFQTVPGGERVPEDEPGVEVAQPSPLSDDADQRRTSLTFLSVGLLAFVVAMHVLWLRGQVDALDLEPAPVDHALGNFR